MNNITALTVEQQARKEAWNANSWNLWSRNTRSSSWSGPNTDIERDGGDHSPMRLSKVHTEPSKIMHGSFNDHGVQSGPENNTVQESNKYATDAISYCDGILPDGLCETAPNSKAADVKTKKERPWYAGKVLHHKPFTIKNQLQAIIFNSWANILLLALPLMSFAVLFEHNVIIFSMNFIAIIPLAVLFCFATKEISLRVGESLGRLLNASLNNVVKIIVAVTVFLIVDVDLVKTFLTGSILSNLLLSMGMSFFFGGLRRPEQFFNKTVAQTSASLLALSIGSIIIITCFNILTNLKCDQRVIRYISRGTSLILLIVYGSYLYFQLHTHHTIFGVESQRVATKPNKNTVSRGSTTKSVIRASLICAEVSGLQIAKGSNEGILRIGAQDSENEKPEEPQLHIAVAWATLIGSTAIICLCTYFLVHFIPYTYKGIVSIEFIGLILLPIIGNTAEHVTAVSVAVKDKMDLAIGVLVESSMQIALLIIPLMNVIGWIMTSKEVSLNFNGLEVVVLFVSVLLLNYVISDGKSHWLEGMLLISLYLIIAICTWYYPDSKQSASKCQTKG